MKKALFLFLAGCLIWSVTAQLGQSQTSPAPSYIGDDPPTNELLFKNYLHILGPDSKGLTGVFGIHKEKEGFYSVLVATIQDPKKITAVVLMFDLLKLETKEWATVLPNSTVKKYFIVMNIK
jgi:hypothetical protein